MLKQQTEDTKKKKPNKTPNSIQKGFCYVFHTAFQTPIISEEILVFLG